MSLKFEDLKVYKIALKSAVGISKLVDSFPRSSQFGVGDQMVRASQSVMANISEGYGRRKSKKEFIRYLVIALGSSDELRSHLHFVKIRGLIDEANYSLLTAQCIDLSAKLHNFITAIKREQ